MVSQNEKNTCQTIVYPSVFLTLQNDNYWENTCLLYPKCIISGHVYEDDKITNV